MLQNVLRMICDANGVPFSAVICKRIVPRPDSDDIDFGLQYSEYASHDDETIELVIGANTSLGDGPDLIASSQVARVKG